MQVVSVNLNDITIPPDRIREEFDLEKIEELRSSLEMIGQLHPIVLERDNSLIAGQRRLIAAKLLMWDTIAAVYRDDLDPLTRKIIEYDENRRRAALTWQEDAKAIAEIHALRQQQDTSWTYQKTADELGLSVAKVHEDINLAAAIQDDTVLGNVAVGRILNRPTRTGALITMKREREAALIKELAKRKRSGGQTKDESGRIIVDDNRVVLATLDPNSIDLIITDPPWLIDVGQTSATAKLKNMGYADTNDEDEMAETFLLLYNVLKPGCHLYCFFSMDDYSEWIARISLAGFVVRSRPLIWVKEGWHGISDPYRRFMTGYDGVFWAYKPDDGGSYRNFVTPLMEIASYPPPTSWHPAAKPPDLLKSWIEASSVENEIVLDPFCGSGQTLIAAVRSGRRYLGIEEDETTGRQCIEDVDKETHHGP